MTRYARLSIKGTLGTSEVWSINPVLDPSNEIPGAYDQAKWDAFVAAVGAIAVPTQLKAAMSTACAITAIRAEMRDTDTMGFLGASEWTPAAPIAGTGTPSLPPQSSVVMSLRTASALPSGRGRLYWPTLNLAVSSTTLRMQAAKPQQFATEMSSYLTQICAAAGANIGGGAANWGVSVYSPTLRTLTAVTTIKVGDVIDTQRRRRDKMPELYSTAPFPTP